MPDITSTATTPRSESVRSWRRSRPVARALSPGRAHPLLRGAHDLSPPAVLLAPVSELDL